MTAGEARERARELLTNTSIPANRRSSSPNLDVDIILSFFLGITRTALMAHPEVELARCENDFFNAIQRRCTGEPVAYIIGFREFWGLEFIVNPSVLIPKPDTEILVERAINLLTIMEQKGIPSGRTHPMLMDVCTGSGCIAIAIKHTLPEILVTATDISDKALEISKLNSQKLLNQAITLIENDLRTGLPHPQDKGWDMIVSNPPYVPSMQTKELLADGRNEPALALDGGRDGLDLIRPLVRHAFTSLVPGGIFLVETGEYNAQDTAIYLRETGFTDIVINKDLENQDRVVEGRKP